jgi:histidinol-phosphate aminotransferase
MPRPSFTPIISALPPLVPFVGPEQMERQRGRPFRARLGANENAFGPSPKALAAMHDAVPENWKYSDPENFDLRAAIAAQHGVAIGNVVVGEGIDGLLGLTCMLFLEPGDRVVTTKAAYPTFNFHVAAHGGRLTALPMDAQFREDIPRLMEAARAQAAKLVYVSNPNSPFGSFWPQDTLRDMIADLPDGTVLVLDEAYGELAPRPGLLPVDPARCNVIRYRTFSKAYGLAGARIGYAIGEAGVIAGFEKVRNHYGINRTGQIGALAALDDQDYLCAVTAKLTAARRRIAGIADAAGLRPLPSAASFVAIDCGGGSDFAGRVLDGLLARDVFIRKPVVPGLDHVIRVSCGLDQDLDVFAEELPRALAAAGRLRG